MDSLKMAIVQMVSTESVTDNFDQIVSLYKSLGSNPKLDMLCLPENSLYNKISNSSTGIQLSDPVILKLQELVDQEGFILNLGAIPFNKNGSVYNTTVLMSPEKEPRCVYDKIHLFDISIGDLVVSESSQFKAGSTPSVSEELGWKMGYSICYDVRFSELFLNYHQQNTEVIFVPAAFTRHTGRAHWQTLIRARAIENQCYIVAPAQAGEAKLGSETRLSYGHSMVVDPWGRVEVHMSADKPEIEVVHLKKSLISKTRKNMPIDAHRKL